MAFVPKTLDYIGRASGRRAGRHPPHDPHHRLPEKIRGASFPHALRTGAGRPQAGRRLPRLGRGRPIPRNAAVPCQDGGTVRHTAHAAGIPCPFPVTMPPALRGHAPFFSGALSCRASPFRARHLP